MGKLDGRAAVITGGGTGIGKAIARRFHEEGAFVVVCGRRMEKLNETCAELSTTGDRVAAVGVDVTDEEDIARLFAEAVSRAGKVDILVNNAGVMRFAKLHETPQEQWDLMMRTNVWAPWRLMVHALPYLRRSGGGSIINVSSIAGIKAFSGSGVYCASKAALQTLSQVMAMEAAADGIRVNCILPALVEDTELSEPILARRMFPPSGIACALSIRWAGTAGPTILRTPPSFWPRRIVPGLPETCSMLTAVVTWPPTVRRSEDFSFEEI